jgi:hypothetical protein
MLEDDGREGLNADECLSKMGKEVNWWCEN